MLYLKKYKGDEKMIIQKRRINNVKTYITRLGKIEEFYICVKNYDKNIDILRKKQICMSVEQGVKFVPRPIGPVTRYNADGKRVARKDLKKEPRTIEHDYHIVDWHGQDHYGTCYQTRMCYPIEVLLPPCEEIIIDKEVIRSNILINKDLNRVKHIINMFLEIFGMCEIVDSNLQPVTSKNIKTVPWRILPPGKYPWDKAKRHLDDYLKRLPNNKKNTIQKRHKILSDFNPDFLAIGEESFRGYVVYGYTEKDMYFFESNEPENATYIFKGKWEDASKLTKRDIISGDLCHKRLIHNENWERNIAMMMKN